MFNIANHKEIQVETTVRHDLTPATIATIRKNKILKVNTDVEKVEPLHTIGGNVNI